MNATQRHELYLLLMGPALDHPEDIHELSEMVVEEVEILEPFIDQLVEASFGQGKMEAYLELLARQEVRWEELKKAVPGIFY